MRRTRHLLIAAACALAGAGLCAGRASAAVGSTGLFTTDAARAPGTPFWISVELDRGRYRGGDSPRLTISVDTPQLAFPSGESHDLEFTLAPDSMSSDPRRRVVRIRSGTQMGRWGSIDMVFRAQSTFDRRDWRLGSCRVPSTTYEGTLEGLLTIRLDGFRQLRIGSLPVMLRHSPSAPLGCWGAPPGVCGDALAAIADPDAPFAELLTPFDPSLTWDEGHAFLDAIGETTQRETSGLAFVAFTDPGPATTPALVTHMALSSEFELHADAGTRTATLRFGSPLLAGTLEFVPDETAVPATCGSHVVLPGSISGDLAVSFRWGGFRRLSGPLAAALWLPAGAPPAPDDRR